MKASAGANCVRPHWTRTILCAVTAAIFGSLVLIIGCASDDDDPIEPTETTYRVTVTGGTGGGNYAAGATVSITANTPPEGQVFDEWTAVPAAHRRGAFFVCCWDYSISTKLVTIFTTSAKISFGITSMNL